MNTKLAELRAQLVATISKFHSTAADEAAANIALYLADQGLEELKKYASQFTVKSAADHELYYRILLPLFTEAYQYFARVCRALEVKRTYGREIYSDYLNDELDLVTRFLKYHLQYTQPSFQDYLETSLSSFSSPTSNPKMKKSSGQPSQQLQLPFYSPGLKPHVDYKAFLEAEKKQLSGSSPAPFGDVYEFVGSQADAMEHIEGWTEMKVIKVNGEYANLRQVAEMWTNWFRKPIPNIYSKKRINQTRKKEKAPFISKMAEVLRQAADRPRSK